MVFWTVIYSLAIFLRFSAIQASMYLLGVIIV